MPGFIAKSLARLRRWLARVLLIAVVAVVLLPIGLALLYRFVPPPVTPLMVIRMTEGFELDRRWVDWQEIPPAVRESVIAAEDNLFCSHNGFDVDSLLTSIEAYIAGERAGGGSTISMQTAKNLFLWPSRSVVRKLLELPLTALIEGVMTKQRILEIYLNIAEWGPGRYGIEAAARHHFGRAARDLSARQAAQLAAVLPSPLRWRPSPATDFIAARADDIQSRVRQLGPMLDCVSD